MAAGTNKNVAYIAIIGVTIPILVAAWFAAPTFLPMYRWMDVDLRRIAQDSGLSEAAVATEYTMKVRYNPRGEGDPLPWQIITCAPAYHTVNTKVEDEAEVLVRCTFVSANDGKPPGTAFINSTYKDRYYTAKGLRLPAGSLGFNAKRTVVIYNPLDLVRMEITQASMTQLEIKAWESDDEWNDRDDGFQAAQ